MRKNPEVKIVFMRTFGTTLLNVVDPEYIRKLSFDHVGSINKRNFLIFIDEIKYGLIFSEGELWKQSRKLLSNLFHFNVLEARSNIMEQVVSKKIKTLHKEKPDLFKLGCSIGG